MNRASYALSVVFLTSSLAAAGTFSITSANSVTEDISVLETAGAVLGEHYIPLYLRGVPSYKFISSPSLKPFYVECNFGIQVDWNADYPGELPGPMDEHGAIEANLTYTPYVCVYGEAGNGSITYNGKTVLTSTRQKTENWIKCTPRTERFRFFQDDVTDKWFAYPEAGTFHITAADGAIVQIKIIPSDVTVAEPLSPFWNTLRIAPGLPSSLAEGIRGTVNHARQLVYEHERAKTLRSRPQLWSPTPLERLLASRPNPIL